MTGDDRDEPAWHERTSTVVGASAAALAAIGLLWLVISWMVGGSDDPGPESQYYLEPSVSGSRTASSTTTTTSTETITSTSPPVTTDINPGDTTTTSSTDTTSPGDTTPPRTRRSTTDGDGPSTRQRPRLNETRTLYPRP